MLLAAGRIPGLSCNTCLRRGGAGSAVRGSTTGGALGRLHFLRELQVLDVFCHRPPIVVFLPTPSSSEKGDERERRSNAWSAFSRMIRPSSGGRQSVEVSGHPFAISDFLQPLGEGGVRWSQRDAASRPPGRAVLLRRYSAARHVVCRIGMGWSDQRFLRESPIALSPVLAFQQLVVCRWLFPLVRPEPG
jgi:hypothetical protein